MGIPSSYTSLGAAALVASSILLGGVTPSYAEQAGAGSVSQARLGGGVDEALARIAHAEQAFARGDIEEAKSGYHQLITDATRTVMAPEDHSIITAAAYYGLGRTYAPEDKAKASQYLAHALAIYERNLPGQHGIIENVRRDIAALSQDAPAKSFEGAVDASQAQNSSVPSRG